MKSTESLANRKRLRPKTYSVTIYFVGLIILIQAIILLSTAFALRQRFIRIETSGSALMETWTPVQRQAALVAMNPKISDPHLPTIFSSPLAIPIAQQKSMIAFIYGSALCDRPTKPKRHPLKNLVYRFI